MNRKQRMSNRQNHAVLWMKTMMQRELYRLLYEPRKPCMGPGFTFQYPGTIETVSVTINLTDPLVKAENVE